MLNSGVCISHAAVLDALTIKSGLFEQNNVLLCFSTFYWITGIITLVLGTLTGSTRIITTDVFSPELQLRLIEQYKITFIFNATHQLVLIAKSLDRLPTANLSSWKYVVVCGSQVPFHIKSERHKYLPNGHFVCAYGMTEAGGIMTIDYPCTGEKDTVGRLYDGCQVKVIDDMGRRCDANETGEICIKMRYRFIGYYGNQQATAETIDNDGFIVSGDMGYFDDDGDLHITGRKKELLKYCNFPISPSEIDSWLIARADIEAACVIGLPDAIMSTDLPAAAIVRAKGSKITEQDVYDLVAGKLKFLVS